MTREKGFRRLLRLSGLLRDAERELDEELAFHFEQAVDELVAGGMERTAAEREARRRFGNEARHRKAILAADRRHVRRRRAVGWLSALGTDLAGAARRILRRPSFAAAVMGTLALGIGANVTIFTVVDRLLLQPPAHVADADRVRRVYVDRTLWTGERAVGGTLTYPDYRTLTGAEGVEGVAAWHTRTLLLGEGEDTREVEAVLASHTLFPVLGVEASLGRVFGPDEDVPGAPGRAVLADGFWRRALGADPEVLGRVLTIGDERYVVVGVAPPGFTGAEVRPVDVFLPLDVAMGVELGTDYRDSHGWWVLGVVTRLGEGVGSDAVARSLTARYRSGREAAGVAEPDAHILTSSLVPADRPGELAGDAVAVSRWLAGVSLVVLLVACANVGNLLLARAVRLRRELAVRVALGVSRGRLVRQLLLESLLLALGGALLAVVLAWHGGEAVRTLLVPDVTFHTVLGPRLLLFITGAVASTALLAGAVPAWWSARAGIAEVLKDGGERSTGSGGRARSALLAFQTALSVLLLVGAGLFVESLHTIRTRDAGIDPRPVLEVRLEPGPAGWSDEERSLAFERLRDALLASPAVEAAAVSAVRPLQMVYQTSVEIPGRDSLPSFPGGGPFVAGVGPGYFDAMGLRIIRGRGFEAVDASAGAARVAVVTETVAGAFWPEEEALGRCMIVGRDEEEAGVCSTVVGVVEDHALVSVREVEPRPIYYTMVGTPPFASGPATAVVRAAGDVGASAEAVREVARSVAPGLRFVDVRPLADEVTAELRPWSLGATLFTVFGVLALAVAAVGLYGVLSFEVTRRRHELGIRATLGASAPELAGWMARQVLGVVAVGGALGIVAALVLAPRIEELLFLVSPREPAVYLAVAALLAIVALAVAAGPIRRAVRVEPVEAIRTR